VVDLLVADLREKSLQAWSHPVHRPSRDLRDLQAPVDRIRVPAPAS
jgi:hypothetical protein